MATVYRDAHVTLARIASESAEMDAAADLVHDAVRARAVQHRDTGNYLRNLGIVTVTTRRGVKDRLIVADDEDAQLIEFGGVVKATGRVIPGLHIMRDGLNDATR